MARDISTVVREICLSFPDSEELVSHGSPNFRVRKGKVFAVYAVNTHGDGRIALWLNVPDGAQSTLVQSDPQRFFVPPYLGPRGWVGVCLDQGLAWTRIGDLVREAYRNTAPAKLHASIAPTLKIKPPETTLAPEDFNPLQSAPAQKILKKFGALCRALPEVDEPQGSNYLTWRANKKTFAMMYMLDEKRTLAFRVGAEMQSMLIEDPRYRIPPYMGHNGWIALDVSKRCDWQEIEALMLQSYRHFALKRMLAKLDA